MSVRLRLARPTTDDDACVIAARWRLALPGHKDEQTVGRVSEAPPAFGEIKEKKAGKSRNSQ
jgi:hypothetical protein